MDGRYSDDSEIEAEQEDRGRLRADDVYPERWRSIH